MRIERNFSLKGLAAACGGEHTLSWVQKVEKDRIDLKLSDLRALADALGVTAGWLVSGDYEDSEFMSQLRGMEVDLDERGRRAVVVSARQEVEEARKSLEDDFERVKRALIAGGVPPEKLAAAELEAMRILHGSDEQDAEEA